jgi:hypothetical protein
MLRLQLHVFVHLSQLATHANSSHLGPAEGSLDEPCGCSHPRVMYLVEAADDRLLEKGRYKWAKRPRRYVAEEGSVTFWLRDNLEGWRRTHSCNLRAGSLGGGARA